MMTGAVISVDNGPCSVITFMTTVDGNGRNPGMKELPAVAKNIKLDQNWVAKNRKDD